MVNTSLRKQPSNSDRGPHVLRRVVSTSWVLTIFWAKIPPPLPPTVCATRDVSAVTDISYMTYLNGASLIGAADYAAYYYQDD